MTSLFQQFWATQLIIHISTVYIFCLTMICLCLFLNRHGNLIYKVINLAVLSVFVVALWSYLTDITFIYIVYILTFVSAVVMLFLSVVLMLPASAVAVRTKLSAHILIFSSLSEISLNLFMTIMFLLIVYSVCAPQHLRIWLWIAIIIEYSWLRWLKYYNKVLHEYRHWRRINFFLPKFNLNILTSSNLETLAQLLISWSVFLLALPLARFPKPELSVGVTLRDLVINFRPLENLSSIQYELYIGSPLLILVCVVGLLVALIGAALLVSTKTARIK